MPLLHHPLHLFQMTDGPGQPVHHRPLVLMDMSMGVGNAVRMKICVVMFVCMFRHDSAPFFIIIKCIIPYFDGMRKPQRGILV